jgi:hypothetical protein
MDRATPAPMEGTPWQIRAKAAGLIQKDLARLAGKPENTISRQLRGEFGEVPGYLIALILAWESMDGPHRQRWRQAVEAELTRRERERERRFPPRPAG